MIDCRYFNGYKPCSLSMTCDSSCQQYQQIQSTILFIHLGAMGAVVRSTALLKAIRRKHPKAYLVWVTDAPSNQLLQHHQLIDRVLTTQPADLLELSTMEFDAAYVVDKSRKAAGILNLVKVDLQFGFTASKKNGAILPLTSAAEELWRIGLDNNLKFHGNKKTENQLIHEALELGPYQRDQYSLFLNHDEKKEIQRRQKDWKKNTLQPILGINTGCSPTIPYKKLSIQNHIDLIKLIQKRGFSNIVLLGGPEDTERNSKIADMTGVIESETTDGLRDGYISVSACDIVVSGDSLGMHMAIASKAYVVAWFGPTCAHEIDLYDRGEKVLSAVECAPCWKRLCDASTMCYDRVDLNQIVFAVQRGVEFCSQNHIETLRNIEF